MFSRISLLVGTIALAISVLFLGCEKRKSTEAAAATPQASAAQDSEALQGHEVVPEEDTWDQPAGEDPEPQEDEGLAAPTEDEQDVPLDDEP